MLDKSTKQKKGLRVVTTTRVVSHISVGGKTWRVDMPDLGDHPTSKDKEQVLVEAPCGDKVEISKAEYMALRSALDRFFQIQ